MSNVIYKDDKEYPELLKKIGKDAPKQIYYKVRSEKSDQARLYSHNLASCLAGRRAQGCSSVRHVPVHPFKARSIDNKILNFLEREPLGIDEMSRHLEISVSELGVKLSMMEMQGLIELKGDRYYNVK